MPLNNPNGIPLPTFKYLDAIIAVLGTTKTHFWPFLGGSGDDSRDDLELDTYGAGVQTNPFVSQGDATEPFYLHKHPGGVNSVSFDAAENQYLVAVDTSSLSFGNGTTTDAAFSLGMWILPQDITTVDLLAKWDLSDTDREWKLGLDGSSKVEFSLYDDNANASEIGASDTAVVLNVWTFIVVTYDGAQADPGVTFYLNGAADGTGTTETGSYVAMQAGAVNPTLACSLDSSAANVEYTGRIALPFICGKELSAAEVATIDGLGGVLLGV